MFVINRLVRMRSRLPLKSMAHWLSEHTASVTVLMVAGGQRQRGRRETMPQDFQRTKEETPNELSSVQRRIDAKKSEAPKRPEIDICGGRIRIQPCRHIKLAVYEEEGERRERERR